MTALDVFALLVLTVILAAILGAVIALAMLPGRIARDREHPYADAIRVAGWLGMLTGAGWMIAMVWAYAKPMARTAEEREDTSSELRARVEVLERRAAQAES